MIKLNLCPFPLVLPSVLDNFCKIGSGLLELEYLGFGVFKLYFLILNEVAVSQFEYVPVLNFWYFLIYCDLACDVSKSMAFIVFKLPDQDGLYLIKIFNNVRKSISVVLIENDWLNFKIFSLLLVNLRNIPELLLG